MVQKNEKMVCVNEKKVTPEENLVVDKYLDTPKSRRMFEQIIKER